jgi:type IV secretory pathway TraG/TraD family ATPase VirD4
MPSEILNLGPDTAIFLSPGSKPRYLRTVNYWDLERAFPKVKQYKNPPLKWDENPLPH